MSASVHCQSSPGTEQHRKLLRYWLHILNGNLLISNPGEAGAKGSSLFILLLANTRLRLLPLMLPDFTLSISIALDTVQSVPFSTTGWDCSVTWQTLAWKAGKLVQWTITYTEEHFQWNLKEPEDCLRSSPAQDSGNLQEKAATWAKLTQAWSSPHSLWVSTECKAVAFAQTSTGDLECSIHIK